MTKVKANMLKVSNVWMDLYIHLWADLQRDLLTYLLEDLMMSIMTDP